MKSSAMLQSLREAQGNETTVPSSTLAFYILRGNFAVRSFIQQLIANHSPVVGTLPSKARLDFLLAFIRESFDRVETYVFLNNAWIFLSEIENYNLQGEVRRSRLQKFITLLEELHGDVRDEDRLPTIALTNTLVRLFPETADNRLFTYSPELASYIADSAVIYARRYR